MSKQTALNWYRLESQKLMIKAIRKEISNEEWRLLENKLGEEAKEMEQEQIIETWKRGNLPTSLGRVLTAEEYYNETYGGNNDN